MMMQLWDVQNSDLNFNLYVEILLFKNLNSKRGGILLWRKLYIEAFKPGWKDYYMYKASFPGEPLHVLNNTGRQASAIYIYLTEHLQIV